MEIILFSGPCKLTARVRQAVEAFLKYRKAELLSLHPASPVTRNDLFQLFRPGCYYLIIVQPTPDGARLAACREAQQLLEHRVRFLLFGAWNEDCLYAVQAHLALVGCLTVSAAHPEQQIAEALLYLAKEIHTVWGGLFVRLEDGYTLIPFGDICYIEAVKGTHRCAVFHRGGRAELRENIRDLSRRLDARFFTCRSSTIANLSKVQRIDFKHRYLYFPHDLSCCFAASRQAAIRAMATHHPYEAMSPLFIE